MDIRNYIHIFIAPWLSRRNELEIDLMPSLPPSTVNAASRCDGNFAAAAQLLSLLHVYFSQLPITLNNVEWKKEKKKFIKKKKKFSSTVDDNARINGFTLLRC